MLEKIKERISLLYLILFTILLYFGYLGIIDLWNPDEPRYVEVAREMFSFKNFLVPHLNGAIYAHKPPLFFWAIAGVVTIFGSFKEWVVRLVPSISGFLIVMLTYFYGSKVFDKKTGLFSSLVLVGTLSMMHLSRRCNIDTLFTLLILIAFIFLHFGILKPEKRRIYFLLSCVFQGLGIITKGPLAFIFPFFTLLSYIIATNDKKLLKETPWFTGLVIILGVVAIWLVPAGLAGGKEYTEALIFKHTVERYAHGMNHPRNFFYYFYNFPLNFLPWSVFLPFIILKGIFNRKRIIDKKLLWFMLWFGVNFIFMCFSTEKRGLYLLPLFPAVSVIFGYYLSRDYNDNIKLFKIPYMLIVGAVIIASLGMTIFYYYKFKEINVILTVLSAFSFWGGIFALKYYKNFNRNFKFFVLSFIWMLALFNVYAFMFPMFNEHKSPKVFINYLNKYEKNWDNVVFFNFYHAGFNFYLKRDNVYHTTSIDELKKFIKKKVKVIIVKKQSVKDVIKYLKNYDYKETRELGHRKLAIYVLKKAN